MLFPTFNGATGKDAQEFLDNLEIACLVTGWDDDATRLRVFPLLMKAEAKFVELWERWVASLRLGEAAPNFLKKDCFVAGLCPPLREKVKGRLPVMWMDARDIARLKERKIRCQLQQREVDQEEEGMAPVPPTNAPVAHRGQGNQDQQELLNRITHQLEDLSIHLVRGERGPPPNQEQARGSRRKAQEYHCYNCDENGHAKLKNTLVMPIGKRNTQHKEGRSGPGLSKKKGKSHEDEDVKAKRKRRARRKFHVSDFPLGDGQLSYDLKEDLTSRKVDVTFGQLIEIVPKLKQQWKRMVHPKEKEPERGSVKVLAMDELPDIFPIVDVWHKRKNVIGKPSESKMFGCGKELEVEVYDAKMMVNFHVMPARLGAYPIILGRPWLRAVGAVQDWRRGTISLYEKTGAKKLYNMDTRKVLEEPFEDEDESSDEDYFIVFDKDTDSTTSSDEDVDVAFLLMDKEIHESGLVAFANEIEDESEGPYEVTEALMQTKVELSKKQELMTQMISGDLLAMEKEIYLHMLASFLDLFITSYEEIRVFKGEEMHIELKEGGKPVQQRLRTMGQEQMKALQEEVDKLLKAGFIVPVETTEWNTSLKEMCFKIKGLLKKFEAWSIRHIERALNGEAREAAQSMIGEIFVLSTNIPLYHG
ncbi:hypothetical protein L7F22_040897 [Adiantum nelumboides]|nr:hypothetical protein [Adiantum nelumboides]